MLQVQGTEVAKAKLSSHLCHLGTEPNQAGRFHVDPWIETWWKLHVFVRVWGLFLFGSCLVLVVQVHRTWFVWELSVNLSCCLEACALNSYEPHPHTWMNDKEKKHCTEVLQLRFHEISIFDISMDNSQAMQMCDCLQQGVGSKCRLGRSWATDLPTKGCLDTLWHTINL